MTLLVTMAFLGIIILLLTLILRNARAPEPAFLSEPPLLPSTVPLFQHLYRYAFDLENLYRDARKFSPSSHPVSLSFLGQRIYLVLSQDDTNAICRQKSRLPYGPLLDWALPRILGISDSSLDALKQDHDGPGTSIFEQSMSIVREALKPGSSLDDFTASFLAHLHEGLRAVDLGMKEGEMRANLFSWTYDLVGTSSTRAMMGPRLLQYDPALLERNRQFEDDFFLFALGLPRFLIRSAWSNRTHIHDTFRLRLTQRSRIHREAAWWVDESERLTSNVVPTEVDVAAPTFGLWHALQTNPNNIVFWMLAHIICSQSLLELLRSETAPAFDGCGSELMDIAVVLDEKRCPHLHSLYYETLRFSSSATVACMVAEDTVVSGYTFRQGAIVLCPARLHHFNPTLWGPDVDQFVPSRFVGDHHALRAVRHLRPFGNAPRICPGRFFAIREILSVVCSIIQRYDITAEECEQIPGLHLHSPSFGSIKPTRDMKVVIRKRRGSQI